MVFTIVMPGAGVTFALAGSVSRTVPPSGSVPSTVPTFVCCTPAAGAGRLAVQVIDSPTVRVAFGQVMAEAATLSSVTATSLRATLPLLVTS